MRRLWAVLAAFLVTGAVGAWLVAGSSSTVPRADTVQLNDIAHAAARQWPTPGPLPGVTTDHTVTDLTGTVLLARGEPMTSALSAAEHRAFTVPVEVGGQVVGFVHYVDPAVDALADLDHRIRQRMLAVIAAVTIVGCAAWAHLYARVLRPFQRLEDFAARVAAGDLDAPLEMDRANAFGAFTESFDLMRTQLAESLARETEAEAAKERLVTQIGHDIRTPVASIAAAAELLTATMPPGATDTPTGTRLGTISAKAAQVDRLLSDLFHANERRLSALDVTSTELTSHEVARLVAHADFDERADVETPPECLVRADPLRLQQVLDNVVVNSYKYAGTPIRVTWSFGEGFLVAHVADTGPGVPPADLDLIFGPGVRGSTVGDVPGSGLGLFTSAHLMERMGGAISAHDVPGGFVIDVEIPLAGGTFTEL